MCDLEWFPKIGSHILSMLACYAVQLHVNNSFGKHANRQTHVHTHIIFNNRPSLFYSLFPITARINFQVAAQSFNYLIIDHMDALLVYM